MTLNTLNHAEVVEFDHDVLAHLCAAHGLGTEQVIAGTLTQIEDLLCLAGMQVMADELSGLSRTCTDLCRLSKRIGMRTMTQAAESVLDCIANNNRPALAACSARMIRLGTPETIEHWTVRHNTVA